MKNLTISLLFLYTALGVCACVDSHRSCSVDPGADPCPTEPCKLMACQGPQPGQQ